MACAPSTESGRHGRALFCVVALLAAAPFEGTPPRHASPPVEAPPAEAAPPPTTSWTRTISAATVPAAPAKPTPELPRGGRTLFPQHRLVGFCGTPGASKLGRLKGNLDRTAKQIETLAEEYTPDGRMPLVVFELIAVIAKDVR